MSENRQLTLGSLFDGSGGFPLGGVLAGIAPLWASEVEPFAIRVTTMRLPAMKHYGDVSKLDGADLPPVDIITFGSPCQDMSIAGRRAGLDGSRSGLFHEAIRIIREMRSAMDGKYPRYIVWENVPGAFSSNGGADFRSVLEEICRVKDGAADVPQPDKWESAGQILAEDYSVAWRVFDAQYWGVPQRRKRIYLVADFAGQRAPDILFKGYSFTAIARELTAMGIKTPMGRDKWLGGTVQSILTNEKYKGCALLQKSYTADYLTKKVVRNDGAVPQYFVEGSHDAIIEPVVFDRVQEMIAERKQRIGFSGSTIFSSKIKCSCCGGWYGSKVWHSTDQYRKIIWRCNAKYGKKTYRCKTPHVTEEEIKAAFIRAVNRLAADRETLLLDLREVQQTLSDTGALVQRLRELDERMNAEAEAVQEMIAVNARVAQNQEEYGAAYDALVSRYEATKAERDQVDAEIRQRGIRYREFERFIAEVEKLPEVVTEFDEALWASLVAYVTVYAKDDLRFTMTDGSEIKA